MPLRSRRAPRLAAAAALVLAPLAAAPTAAHAAELPKVKHVWTIVLENSDELQTVASDTGQGMGELTTTLRSQGAFLADYYGTGHSSLDNYISLVSGQGPTPQTQGDCNGDSQPIGGDRQHARFDADGQALGTPAKIAAGQAGCTYPADVPTLAGQLEGAGLTWRTYAQGVDASPTTLRTTCQSAQYAGLRNSSAPDSTFAKNYARKHDPLLYFYGVTGLGATPRPQCDDGEVGLGRLSTDLASAATTPNWSLIVPDLCNDAHDSTGCAAGSAGPDGASPATTSGVPQADEFLKAYVPKILASPAFADGGLLLITFDEGTEALSCCGEVTSPDLPSTLDNGTPSYLAGVPASPATRGGGLIGAVAISPFITPGTVSTVPYNHYSYLRSMEDLFRLTPDRTGIAGSDGAGHLGFAGSQGGSPAAAPASFGSDVFTASATAPAALPESRWAALLPVLGLALVGGFVTRRTLRSR